MRYVLMALIIGTAGLVHVAADVIEHEVKPGDTLYGIARTYGITVGELSRVNGIESPDLLLPGTILTVGHEYRVVPGDTLFAIARAHGTTVDTLQTLNDLEGSRIVTGQVLKLPLTRVRSTDASPAVAARSPGNDQSRDATPSDRDTTVDSESTVGGESRDGDVGGVAKAEKDDSARVVMPVAISLDRPISFADGGSWPVAGPRTTLEGKLPGVLIRADRGAPVAAIASGRVVYAGPHSTFGNVVFIQSPQGYIYVYGGQEQVLVGVGDTVSAGATVGMVGSSPNEGGAALYFSVWRNDTFVDPESAPRG